MFFKSIGLCSLLIIFLTGCSATLGGAAYSSGRPEHAAGLYTRGADQGDKTAALKLGLMISEGKVSAGKYGNHAKWFIRACELGSDVGCHNGGVIYESGIDGIKKDYSKAREYFLMAAEKGYMQSQYNLSSLYANQYFDNDIEGLK